LLLCSYWKCCCVLNAMIKSISSGAALLCVLQLAPACESLTGVDDLSIESPSEQSAVSDQSSKNSDSEQAPDNPLNDACRSNRECTQRATAASRELDLAQSPETVPAVCIEGKHCVTLTSKDCQAVTGDYLNDAAIVVASLFSTVGPQAMTNLHRERSALLAVSEINAAGGIPTGASSAKTRPLVMVSCNEVSNFRRVATHLVSDLGVPAIVGPNTSQDTLDLSTMFAIAGGTLVISPTAVASSITDLLDDDLTWLMVPTDLQRGPLLIDQIGQLENKIVSSDSPEGLKLGVIYRDDAFGIGTRVALSDLRVNGHPLGDPTNLGDRVKINGYDYHAADQQELVREYAAFAPQVIVLAGTAEAVTRVMLPLEDEWRRDAPRPYYILTDSSKVPELLDALKTNEDLRVRIRGTGVTSEPDSAAVYNAFKIGYQAKYGSLAEYSGMGTAYDATYAVAFAVAAEPAERITGRSVAKGLRKLNNGDEIPIRGTTVLSAFRSLVAGDGIRAIGTLAPLDWDDKGGVRSGRVEIWCVGSGDAGPLFQSSGVAFDIATQRISGSYTPCD
jgi:ABC-type branched-subunit amino acid transport system substrate-binding protein